MTRVRGHEVGVEALRRINGFCKLGLEFLTVYAFQQKIGTDQKPK